MIEFILNNKTIRTSKPSGMTLLDFVRYEHHLTGTKIGCREGDCGACTLLVGALKNDDTVNYQSITSCISPLGSAHGKHIVTVEGTNLQHSLNTAQLAMKENYATQCGFCSPGFVVSLTGFALSDSKKDHSNALDAISGNICRCTGYKSIERATNEVCQKLEFKDSKMSIDWLIDNKFVPEYFSSIPSKLKNLQSTKALQSGTTIVSGGTDLYVQQADQLTETNVQLVLDNNAFCGISIANNNYSIGAATTVSDLWRHKEFNTFFPSLKKHLKLISSEQIRNMASFGGNLVNASPIGDMTIFFLALNSNITITDQKENERIIPLNQFYKSYKTYDLNEGELIKTITFNLPSQHTYFNFEKVCKRTHLDIASVNSAIAITTNGNIIEETHISIGGVAAIPKYLFQTSTFLKGKTLNPQLIIEANTVLQNEISPISDVRGSSDYKRLLARQLFFAHFTELFPDQFKLKDLIQ